MEARTPLGYREPAGARAHAAAPPTPRTALRVRVPLFELGGARRGAVRRWSPVLLLLFTLLAVSLRLAHHEPTAHLDSDRCLELGS